MIFKKFCFKLKSFDFKLGLKASYEPKLKEKVTQCCPDKLRSSNCSTIRGSGQHWVTLLTFTNFISTRMTCRCGSRGSVPAGSDVVKQWSRVPCVVERFHSDGAVRERHRGRITCTGASQHRTVASSSSSSSSSSLAAETTLHLSAMTQTSL